MRVGPQYQANVPDYDPGKWDLTHLTIVSKQVISYDSLKPLLHAAC